MKASARKKFVMEKYQVLKERFSIIDFSFISPSNTTQCGSTHSVCFQVSELRGRQRSKVQLNGMLGLIGGTYLHH